jgi:acyl-CoA synthetase (AMP-forming)/AMP-acid ligase II
VSDSGPSEGLSSGAAIAQSSASTVFDLFRARALLHPGRVALQDARVTRTYGDLEERSGRLAGALAARGIGRGDPIAILSENRVEYLEVVVAAARLGAVVACLNWRLTSRETEESLGVVTPSLVVASPRHRHLLPAATDDRPGILVIGEELESFLATGTPPAPERVDPEDPLLVIYTSGTTGRPKGAAISHRAEIVRNLVTRVEYGIASGDVFAAWTPLFHMGAADNALGTLMCGGKVVVIDGYDPDHLIRTVETEMLGWLLLMPGMVGSFADLLQDRAVRPLGVRVCGVMPDLVSPQQIARVTALLQAPYANTFGSTETGCPPCSAGLLHPGEVPATLAKTQSAFCQVRLEVDGRSAEEGAAGELCMRGPTMFSGYWGAPEVNAVDFRDGWFHMGDLMVRHPDGTLDFVGRAKYLIKSGGENVYPAEVERVLLQHPQVIEAAVVRRPDPRWGEVPVAFVVAAEPPPSEAEMTRLCAQHLASYKRPKELIFVGEQDLPRNDTGKIRRTELERRAADAGPTEGTVQ